MQNLQYASAGNSRILYFIEQLRRTKSLMGAVIVASLLMLGLLNPVFANGFALLMKVLWGISVLGSIL
jgi:hypothetical protein